MADSAGPLDGVESLVHAFRAHVDAGPDALAVVDGAERVTYAELAAAAEAVRTDLLADGARAGDRVGISMRRSWRVLAAIVGTLSTGASYVPLDPAYPAARLRFMAGDAALRVACVDVGQTPTLGDAVALVPVRGERSGDAIDPAEAVRSGYVIYTSGSTGTPKGVPVPQGHVLELFAGACDWGFSFGPDDVWTLYHSYSFDFSVWEIWGALLFGGTVVVVDEAASRDPKRLLALADDEGVSVLSQVPSPFKYVVRAYERDPRPLDRLRYVVFGGEAMDKPSTRRWLELRPGRERIVNMYGITETTVHVTAAVVTPDDVADDATPTRIGRPLPHLDVELVDPDGNVVTGKADGEMWVAGSTLTPGYLNRDDLTVERFPTAALAGAERRWYRSGDLARRDDSGELHYLGRVDGQVNLRGFRIELGEIEAALRDDPSVDDAAATVTTLPGGERALVALVVVSDGADPPAPTALRALCRERLPAYMVPDRVTVVDDVPTTPSGKVDRAAVADVAARLAARPHRAPRPERRAAT